MEAFKTVSAMDKGLYAAQVYMDRIASLKSNPPSPDWDGAFTMKEK
jgi:hypothetical protein